MSDAQKKCMICGKPATVLNGGICQPCQDRIRREALGGQADISERAERELIRHGVKPVKK